MQICGLRWVKTAKNSLLIKNVHNFLKTFPQATLVSLDPLPSSVSSSTLPGLLIAVWAILSTTLVLATLIA